MTTALILSIVLSTAVFAAMLGLAAWAIATAHHDHHVMFSGPKRERVQRAARSGYRRAAEAAGLVLDH
jgi:hypothetical protein